MNREHSLLRHYCTGMEIEYPPIQNLGLFLGNERIEPEGKFCRSWSSDNRLCLSSLSGTVTL